MSERSEKTIHGLLVEFNSTTDLLSAAEKVRDAGYQHWDCHSPIPIHGMDDAMGIRPTILPWFVLLAGFTGLAAALLMQWWMNAVDYPIIVSGKPFFSLPANIPVTFELIVLFSALAAVGSLFVLNNLPQWYHPLFSSDRFRQVTTDKFFIYIESTDPKFDADQTRLFLAGLGGNAIELIED